MINFLFWAFGKIAFLGLRLDQEISIFGLKKTYLVGGHVQSIDMISRLVS